MNFDCNKSIALLDGEYLTDVKDKIYCMIQKFSLENQIDTSSAISSVKQELMILVNMVWFIIENL